MTNTDLETEIIEKIIQCGENAVWNKVGKHVLEEGSAGGNLLIRGQHCTAEESVFSSRRSGWCSKT